MGSHGIYLFPRKAMIHTFSGAHFAQMKKIDRVTVSEWLGKCF